MKEIALHILDITQNSIKAGANEIRITLSESIPDDLLSLTIADNGKGMDAESCRRASDPWFTSRTTRKVGLGLPLLKMNAGLTGGGMTIDSELPSLFTNEIFRNSGNKINDEVFCQR